MTLANSDLVQETTSTTGTGTLTLSGAVAGYQSFAIVGTGNTTYYCIRSGTNKEVGIGTYTASGTTLSRDTVLYSSAGGTTKITVAAGATVINTYPAETSVSGGGGGTYPTIQPSLNLDFANTKLLDPRITFVRNSTAAYYDGQTTALAEQNLLTYSQDFSQVSTWTPNLITQAYSAAPDGTNSALLMTGDGTVGTHRIGYTNTFLASSAQRTYSVYAKAGTNAFIQIYLSSDANAYANFDVTNGAPVVGTVGSSATASTPVLLSNGWYRCSITTASAGGTNPLFAIISSLTAIRAEVNSLSTSVYIWGAQLEQRSSATAYTPTTTAAITNYIPVLMTAPAGVARFDCDPITGKSLGLLIEELRTNLATYSSDFSNAAWGGTGGTRTTNAVISPDGTLTGNRLTEDTAFSTHGFTWSTVPTSGAAYALSIYMKANGRTLVQFSGGGLAGQGFTCTWDISNGTMDSNTGSKGSIVSVGNGWYRCTVAFTTSNTVAFTWNIVSSGTGTYTGDGYSGIYIWGAQLEAGSFATSYIPTVASTVTRAADQASITGTNFSSWYNQSQGTFYAEFTQRVGAVGAAVSATSMILIGNDANTRFAYIPSGSSNLNMYDGATIISTSAGGVSNTPIKYAIALNPTTASACTNGLTVYSGAFTKASSTIQLGLSQSGTINGTFKKITYYPVALSSSNLVALTS